MIEAITEDNMLLKIFFMKDPDYVMKIIVSWIALDELEIANPRRGFIDSRGTKETKQFTYWQTFGIDFWYRRQVDNHNNWIHAPISLESI